MRMYDIIEKKRDGKELSDGEIRAFIDGYTAGTIPDYQAAAFCMAVYFQGMTDRETVTLTDAMAHSGDMLDLSAFGSRTADKHSTGGVGDKTTLIVAPTAASLGCIVTKMSGRGLGHTGGTVDKLESIPGYDTSLPVEKFLSQAKRIGIAVIGQTGNLTPADKKLYALRDVTATVNSIPLITSSIMSKKLAAGSANIVLDVKFGSGAFMKTTDDALTLAENMVRIGKSCGRNVTAVMSDMDVPLGRCIGNALEVREAVNVLKGRQKDDLYEVCVTLASEMVSQVRGIPAECARPLVEAAIDNGTAFSKMKEWIGCQGGDISCLDDTSLLPQAPFAFAVKSRESGYIVKTDAQSIGRAAMILGAGRASKEDSIDMSAGIELLKKPGDRVSAGDDLCILYTSDRSKISQAGEVFLSSLVIGEDPPEKQPLIYKIIR